jgi:glycosyltransferase involved in cell wall biosynthesis
LKLSIIIPVYNEEKLILDVLSSLEEVKLPAFVSDVEIIVIDDCSTDGTFETVKKNKKDTVILHRQAKNGGKGAAVKAGISLSSGDVILIQDADLELIPKDIPLMLNTMHELGVEFVNGSRYMPGIIRPLYSYRRYFFNKVFTKLASILINVRLTDLACGYKLFTRNIYNQISLKEERFGFEAELLIKVAKLKKTLIAEVPVHYFPRNVGAGKKIRNIDGIKIFWTILKYGLFRMA